MVHGPRHFHVVDRLTELLYDTAIRNGCRLRAQAPISIPPQHEPEPDLAIVRGSSSDFQHRHPTAAETLVVVEVSLTSLQADRKAKRRMYGSSGIPEYWIIDVDGRAIEIYTQPEPTGYAVMERFSDGQTVTLRLNEETLSFPVSDILVK